MVTGTFPIFDHDAYILIDLGSTCSFMLYEFALRVNGKIEPLKHSLYVFMPAGGIVVVNSVVKACPILVGGEILYTNLVVIKLDEFDVILGMDWLSQHYATLDCRSKVVIF